MPRIPTVSDSGRSAAGVSGLSPTATNAGFARIADNIDRVNLVRERVLAEDQRQIDAMKKTQALISMDAGLSALYQGALDDEDFVNAPSKFDGGVSELGSRVISGVENEQDRADIALALQRRSTTLGASVRSHSRNRVTGQRRADLAVLLESHALSAAGLDPSDPGDSAAIGENRAAFVAAVESAQADGLIDDAVLRIASYDEAIDFNQAEDLAFNGDPVRAVRDLDNPERFKNIDPTDRIKLRGAARRRLEELETEAESELERDRQRVVSNYEIRLDRGLGNPEDLEAEADELFESGLITGDARSSYYAKAQKAREQQEQNISSQQFIADILDGGTPASPSNSEHKKFVDTFYDEYISASVSEMADEESASVKSRFISSIGIIPSRVKSEIIGGLRGSTHQVVRAADMMDRIRGSINGPQILSDLSSQDVLLGRMVSDSVEAGTPPEMAVERAREAMRGESASRRAALSAILKEQPNSEWLEDEVGDTGFLFFSSDTSIPAAYRDEFAALTEANFLRTGDIEVSRRVALDDLQNVWGETRVGGDRRMMKYAPETMYPEWGGDSSAIESQLFSDVRALGRSVDGRGVRPVADFETARGGARPSYAVAVENENGEYEILMDSETGKPMRWVPDFENSEKGVANRERRSAELARARGTRRLLDKPGGAVAYFERFSPLSRVAPGPIEDEP